VSLKGDEGRSAVTLPVVEGPSPCDNPGA
jgi:hypothetical protein